MNTWLNDIEPSHFMTFIFNRNFKKHVGVDKTIDYGKTKLNKFHKYINYKLLGKYWYRNPDENTLMVLYPQKIHSNLHFHGIAVVKDSDQFPNKVEMFEKHSRDIWKLDKKLSTGRKDVLVPNGELDIQRPDNNQRVIGYSIKDNWKSENHDHFYVSGER